ncbi:MAG: ABC transporter substrate-binding protein [Thermodesulfovibrionales bacterium]
MIPRQIYIFFAFITACLLTLVTSPAFAAEKTIGVIMTGNIPYYREIHKAFTEGLAAEGVGHGAVEIIQQSPNPEPMSWTNAARKLVAVGSDIIVSYGAPATLSVLNETSEIPVVFAGVYDPQGIGVTGKNGTGVSSKVPVASLLKNFKSISNFSNLGVVYSESEKDTVIQANEVKQLESSLNFKMAKFNIRRSDDTAKIANVDALFLTTGCAAQHCVNNILVMARKSKLPTATTIGGGETSGVILTISANPQEQGREAAKIVAKIVRGAKTASIPVQLPKKIDMIINLKEANELGIKIPFDLLTAATRVIK